MKDKEWIVWKMQTSKTWSDIEDVIKQVNIDFIDYDHQMLVEYALQLNILIDQFEKKFSLEMLNKIESILKELYGYAVGHFKREEVFMKKYDLPDIDIHLREHEKILSILNGHIEDYIKGRAHVSQQLKLQLMQWLIGHINETDYDFFSISKWNRNLSLAKNWQDISAVIGLIGISKIDEQHREVTENALSLLIGYENNEDPQYLEKRYDSLLQSIKGHFEFEERIIEHYHIHEGEQHKSKHDFFVKTVTSYHKMVIAKALMPEKMKSWLLTWWINHINIVDKNTFNYKNWAYQLIDEAYNVEALKKALRYTDIHFIDDEHINLMQHTLTLSRKIDLYIEYGDDFQDPGVKRDIMRSFDQILDYATKHFAHEERIMKQYEMSDYLAHHHEHINILNRIKELIDNYESNRLYLSKNVKRMILEWWILHTNTIDYRTFVQNMPLEAKEKVSEEVGIYE